MSGQVVAGKEELSTREVLLWTATGLAVSTGAILLVRRLLIKSQVRQEEDKSFDDPVASYAAILHEAMDGWGTNEETLRLTLRDIPSKEVFDQVVKAYRKRFHTGLLEDMRLDLSTSEFIEMMNIVKGKPAKQGEGANTATNYTAWAIRLKAAFDLEYFGLPATDEEAIRAVFMEIPTQRDFERVKEAYQKRYGKSLMNELSHELVFWELGAFMQIIKSKPASNDKTSIKSNK